MKYGCEVWELKKSTEKRITAFEMWGHKRILKISWIDRITNEEVLRRMKCDRPVLLDQIKKKQLKYFGQVLRGSAGAELKDMITVAVTQRNTGRGRKRTTWYAGVKQLTKKFDELVTIVNDRQLRRNRLHQMFAHHQS